MIHVVKRASECPEILRSEQARQVVTNMAGAIRRDEPIPELPPLYRHSDVRSALSRIYRDKCAFCESKRARDVHHYRPVSTYPFLVYDWSNLLLTCSTCNSRRRAQFPTLVPDSSQVVTSVRDRLENWQSEQPELLHPELDRPEEHLEVWPDGVLRGLSPRGWATIRMFDLNRQELQNKRQMLIDLVIIRLRSGVAEFVDAMGADRRSLPTLFRQAFQHTFHDLNQRADGKQAYSLVARSLQQSPRRFLDAHMDSTDGDIASAAFREFVRGDPRALSDPMFLDALDNLSHAADAVTEDALAHLPQLVSLHISNFRCIDQLDLPLHHPESELPGNWSCIAGINGSGKTSILQALCLCLLGERLSIELGGGYLQSTRRLVDGQPRDAEITVRVSHQSAIYDLTLLIDEDGARERGGPRSLRTLFANVLVSYGATRNLSPYRDQRHVKKSLPVRRQMTLFDPLSQVARAEVLLDDKRPMDNLHALIERVLALIFEGEIKLLSNGSGLSFVVAHEHLPAVDLPDGFRSALAWLVDLCAAWCESYPQRATERPEDIRAIVLIDEIDLHLHPSLQRKLVPRLRSAMPGVQWIVTTHSPFLLSSFDRRELSLLERSADGGIRQLDRQILAFSMDQVYEWLMETTPYSGALDGELAAHQAGPSTARTRRIGQWLEMSPEVDEQEANRRSERRKRLSEMLRKNARDA